MKTKALHFMGQIVILSDTADPITLREGETNVIGKAQTRALIHHIDTLKLQADSKFQAENTEERLACLRVMAERVTTFQAREERILALNRALAFEREERVNLSNERLEALATIEDYRTLLRHMIDLLIIPDLDNSAAVSEVRGLIQFTLDNPEPNEIHDNLVSLGLKQDLAGTDEEAEVPAA